jgi:hypothetical protein
MALDNIWICPSLKREDWFDIRYSERRREPIDETYGTYTVLLSKGFVDDEGYFFLYEADARRFFQGGPVDPGEQSYRDEGKGFDRVELYIQDKLIDGFSLEAGNILMEQTFKPNN